MGHTAFGLADEYESLRAATAAKRTATGTPRDEPAEQNVTIDPQATKKWAT